MLGADHRCPLCFTPLSGTSQAAPLVAGILALFLEEDPTLTPAQLKEKLLKESVDGVLMSGIDRDLEQKTVKKLANISRMKHVIA